SHGVGSRGVLASGGQRRCVSAPRAALAGPRPLLRRRGGGNAAYPGRPGPAEAAGQARRRPAARRARRRGARPAFGGGGPFGPRRGPDPSRRPGLASGGGRATALLRRPVRGRGRPGPWHFARHRLPPLDLRPCLAPAGVARRRAGLISDSFFSFRETRGRRKALLSVEAPG